ncbi:MerR family transcriptional regulator [Deinococcus frigens]|uniref:MerR family transcriptional regulator n=1 Tax=Deinococcus frigens TaxID=249403 RepID=UPI000557EB3E|nr:MerR family transcriptional regulator [Deinococcus frigens]
MKGQTLTPQEFVQCVNALRESFNSTPEFRQGVANICGGGEVLDAMLDPRGLGLGRFAELMELPASTIRHFLREGLIHPYTVNGKFKFLLHNIIEVRGIRQWQSLGLTLDETRAFLEAQQVAGMLIESEGGGMATVTAGVEKPRPEKLQELKATTLNRIREANARLTEKHAVLGRQLEAARALEKSLGELDIFSTTD